MKITFDDIKKKIQEHNPVDLILSCYNVLDNHKEKNLPVWSVFLLIKWVYLHSVEKADYKVLRDKGFSKILNLISNFNQEHISGFITDGKIDKAFHILYHQQFYLQKSVYNQIFESQLKLYSSLSGKYDINDSFKKNTKLSIVEFLRFLKIVWLYINVDTLADARLKFDGYLNEDFLNVVSEVYGKEKTLNFLRLITLNPTNPIGDINGFKKSIGREDLQSMETSFFVMFPFQIVRGNIKLIHKSVIKHTINYYIYDYLKSVDDNFTTEFGGRLEKYVLAGLQEAEQKYLLESELKRLLPKDSKVVDFCLPEQCIYIECKATELQPYPSVNPLDDLLINSLKSSLLKAYFEQLIPVAKALSPKSENWGVIITYKELFWSRFTELYQLGKDKYSSSSEYGFIPYDNVFIIDLYTWDKIIQIIKSKKATLLEILKVAKQNNSNPKTSKQLFSMHLDIYELGILDLDYLKEEHDLLDLKECAKKS